MISIKRGTYRIAIILGPITFKIIKPIFFFEILKCFFKTVFYKKDTSEYVFAYSDFKLYRSRVIKGFFGNMTEFFTWLTVQKNFLAPTYFSCGFFNLQKTVHGEKVSCKELIDKIIQQISEKRQFAWWQVEAHILWENSGWRKTSDGYVLVDYGDSFANGWPFSEVLRRDGEVLERVLKEI